MKNKSIKLLFSYVIILILMSTVIIKPSEISAATVENNKVWVYIDHPTILTLLHLQQTARTPSGNIDITAKVVVQDSTSKIVSISDAYVSGYVVKIGNTNTGIDPSSFLLSSPTIWDNGTYATITITYRQNNTVKSEVCTFFPI
jgi:hypothetical protein